MGTSTARDLGSPTEAEGGLCEAWHPSVQNKQGPKGSVLAGLSHLPLPRFSSTLPGPRLPSAGSTGLSTPCSFAQLPPGSGARGEGHDLNVPTLGPFALTGSLAPGQTPGIDLDPMDR